MKKSSFCVVLIAAGILFAGMRKPDENKMDVFKWLIGTWSTNTGEGRILETWRPMNDSTLEGESTLFKKTTETVQLEKMQLAYRDRDYYYIPVVSGQNNEQPVRFRVARFDKKSFTAENKEHDFPKRISYSLIKKDSLLARIDDGLTVPVKKSDYYYSRVKK